MRRKLYILSPHFDDAALSCTEHILEWKKVYDVIIITIFTSFISKNIPIYSKELLKKLLLSDAQYEKIREDEDRLALQKLGVKTLRLGFTDGGFRAQNNDSIYSHSQKLFSGTVDSRDEKIQLQLQEVWQKIFLPDDIIVAPMGVGKHADHLIIYESIRNIRKTNLWFYLDYPYALTPANYSFTHILSLLSRKKSLRITTEKKKEILRSYATQIPLLFKKSIGSYPEIIVQ